MTKSKKKKTLIAITNLIKAMDEFEKIYGYPVIGGGYALQWYGLCAAIQEFCRNPYESIYDRQFITVEDFKILSHFVESYRPRRGYSYSWDEGAYEPRRNWLMRWKRKLTRELNDKSK